jgi:nicotinamidase-related amidase
VTTEAPGGRTSGRIAQRARSVLLVIDLQDSYTGKLHEESRVVAAAGRLIQAAEILGIPTIATEQYPERLGGTRSEIASLLGSDAALFAKRSFSCLGADGLGEHLRELSRDQVVVAGIETHVCVNQTVHDLLDRGYTPHIARDALTSRFALEDEIGFAKMVGSGAVPTSVESVLFEWVEDSRADAFKAIHKLVV